jgi:hypothetical protein
LPRLNVLPVPESPWTRTLGAVASKATSAAEALDGVEGGVIGDADGGRAVLGWLIGKFLDGDGVTGAEGVLAFVESPIAEGAVDFVKIAFVDDQSHTLAEAGHLKLP